MRHPLSHKPSLAARAVGTSLALILANLFVAAQEPARPVPGPIPQAPPPAPPIQHPASAPNSGGSRPKPLGVTPYSIGQPTDEEQLYLEYLNRMRADPRAEGQALASTTDPLVRSALLDYQVDLAQLEAEFGTNPPVAPLAMNAQLTAAARWHSGDMFTNEYQGHFQTEGSVDLSPSDRISTNGYKAAAVGENVFSYSDSVFYGHAGFAIDWGPGPGGMQNPRGHRINMLSPDFREVGIGVVDGVNGTVGPQLVTQDFGAQFSASPLITGTVYFDLNQNGFYDLGEGIGGVTVNTSGSTYFAVTADSGGYALPVSGDGSYTLTFTGSGISNQALVMISNLQNAKRDYSPVYSPPAISGPNPASVNQNNVYSFTAVPAATGYQWLQAQLVPYTRIEGAEDGQANVTIVSSPGYSVVTSDLAAAGSSSFNLAHIDPLNQSLILNDVLLVTASSQLSFSSLLGFALSNEVAQAQVSIDSGSTWQTVWSEAGNDGDTSVDAAFVDQTIPLGTYAGQPMQVRFVYAYLGGLHFETGTGVGLYLDNIAVSDAQQLTAALTNNTTTDRSFSFFPTDPTNYVLAVRAQINSRTLPWGTAFPVSVVAGGAPPGIQVVAAPVVSGNQVQIDFTVANYRDGMTFQLLKAADLQSAWTPDSSATLQTLVAGSGFRFTTSTGAATRLFFKVSGH